jgi:hypothetical protein
MSPHAAGFFGLPHVLSSLFDDEFFCQLGAELLELSFQPLLELWLPDPLLLELELF